MASSNVGTLGLLIFIYWFCAAEYHLLLKIYFKRYKHLEKDTEDTAYELYYDFNTKQFILKLLTSPNVLQNTVSLY